MTQGKIILIDDDKPNLITLKRALEKVGYEIIDFFDPIAAKTFIENSDNIDLVVTDLKMPSFDGIEILKSVKEKDQTIGVILITAYGSIENAVEAMKLGADDYISKPVDVFELRKRVNSIVEKRRLSKEVSFLKSRLDTKYGFENIIAQSEIMKELLEKVKVVSKTKATVLITGESGSGKELIANAIHQNSDRKRYPFIPINCAAIPASLVESELFGYEKGAFTGAEKSYEGRFEQANRGTLFLDEIGELPLEIQAKLLRVLEEKVVYRIGGKNPIPIDVRIISATNQNLLEKVKEGKFREDLYFRLKVVELNIPPLRERKEDIPFLINHFLKEFSQEYNKEVESVSKELLSFLTDLEYKGNVRELKNLIERMVIFTKNRVLNFEDLPSEYSKSEKKEEQKEVILPSLNLNELEKEAIIKALQKTNGNKTQASKLLGIGLRTLHRKVIEYNIKI